MVDIQDIIIGVVVLVSCKSCLFLGIISYKESLCLSHQILLFFFISKMYLAKYFYKVEYSLKVLPVYKTNLTFSA